MLLITHEVHRLIWNLIKDRCQGFCLHCQTEENKMTLQTSQISDINLNLIWVSSIRNWILVVKNETSMLLSCCHQHFTTTPKLAQEKFSYNLTDALSEMWLKRTLASNYIFDKVYENINCTLTQQLVTRGCLWQLGARWHCCLQQSTWMKSPHTQFGWVSTNHIILSMIEFYFFDLLRLTLRLKVS